MLERQAGRTLKSIEELAPDCLIIDNHLPKKGLSEKLYVLWHGYGWRTPERRCGSTPPRRKTITASTSGGRPCSWA